MDVTVRFDKIKLIFFFLLKERVANFSLKSQMANILGSAGNTVNATQLVKKKKKKQQLLNTDCVVNIT